MMTLIMLILITSFLSCWLKHPLTLGLMLLMHTILIAILTGMMMLNFWSSYIIFLIMIGGMLILFIYMTSVASNEKFKFSYKFLVSTLFLMILPNSVFFVDKFLLSNKLKMIETFSSANKINTELFLNKFINFPNNMIYLMMIVYLLITLIAIVKISMKTKSTFRMSF
uniref:NADH dehydrogenase subunit 6 n=1 Tax=Cryptocephalus dimidiatipennis TaxID=2978450 RepID=UPI0021CCEA9E|nr:NADH dehydrogenase subunit 6 [Cryptocephalus dimidiatipennis]UWV18207.1 NADH dehydrogenase subunit 6 [Cryptocephalus dimidiatipennis]